MRIFKGARIAMGSGFRMIPVAAFVAGFVSGLGGVDTAGAEDARPQTISAVDVPTQTVPGTDLDIALSNIILITHHEIGHALIDQFALPVVGQEEDAVDAFATLLILETYDEPVPILMDSAAMWFALHREARAEGSEPSYYDEHDLDIQRAYRILCLAHGYDPDNFAEAAKKSAIPDERLESCEYDASLALDSWNALLEGAIREGDTPAGKVTVTHRDTKDYNDLRVELESSGVLADIGEWIDTHYAWPKPLTLEAAECGEINAFYDPETVTVTMCYEMFDELLYLAKTLKR